MTEPNRLILEEASAWFVDFRLNDIDPAASTAFDEWLRRSPEHIRAYLEIAQTYAELPPTNPMKSIDIDTLIAKAREQSNVVQWGGGNSGSSPTPVAHSQRERVGVRAIAASLAILCIIASLAAWFLAHRDPTFVTAIGEQRSITLADGSTVQLNARSRVRVHVSDDERTVELLDGQALFEVAKDATRPFIVRSDGTQVRAVGTQFDVNRMRTATTVTVIEGQVAVLDRATPQPILLSAGEQLTVTPDVVAGPKRTHVTAATAIAWTQRRLIFDETRLADVADEFNRYNASPLVIDDAELAELHISGVYSSTDPASLLRFLDEQPGIAIRQTEKEIRITRE